MKEFHLRVDEKSEINKEFIFRITYTRFGYDRNFREIGNHSICCKNGEGGK